jgi:hypothetical protein
VLPVESELQLVADAFIYLQYHRHMADYDFMQTYGRITVLRIIAQVKDTITAWSKGRDRPNANVFLAALLLNRRWNK